MKPTPGATLHESTPTRGVASAAPAVMPIKAAPASHALSFGQKDAFIAFPP
jgi:hypothetical protein